VFNHEKRVCVGSLAPYLHWLILCRLMSRTGELYYKPQQINYCCRSLSFKWSSRGLCGALSLIKQHSHVCSRPSAFPSRRETTSLLVLISRHAPCNIPLFLVQRFHLRRIPQELQGILSYSRKKAGIPGTSFCTREGCSAGAYSLDSLNADHVRLYNNRVSYSEPMQAQTGNMRRLKIGLRTRLINIVQLQHYGFLNRDVDHRGTDAIEIVLQIQRSQVQLSCF